MRTARVAGGGAEPKTRLSPRLKWAAGWRSGDPSGEKAAPLVRDDDADDEADIAAAGGRPPCAIADATARAAGVADGP
jgi:hypothetical protein